MRFWCVGYNAAMIAPFLAVRTRIASLAVLLSLALPLFGQGASEVEITAEPTHRLILQNDNVRVFYVEVAPRSATLTHRHHHDYVLVSLGASDITNAVVGKPPAELKLQDGETTFVPGNSSHKVRNLATTPFRNVTIELMQDEKARNSPPAKWDEERGLHVLEGGTQDIMFVRDGVRVSEIDLQPGGMIPQHHHSGPHLVVAVSDLDLRSDVVDKGPSEKRLKAGEVAWVPGGFTHTVMNMGKTQAKFITLEFR